MRQRTWIGVCLVWNLREYPSVWILIFSQLTLRATHKFLSAREKKIDLIDFKEINSFLNQLSWTLLMPLEPPPKSDPPLPLLPPKLQVNRDIKHIYIPIRSAAKSNESFEHHHAWTFNHLFCFFINNIGKSTSAARVGEKYYSGDSGIKVQPKTVLVISLVYMGVVLLLHIFGKLRGTSAPVPSAEWASKQESKQAILYERQPVSE